MEYITSAGTSSPLLNQLIKAFGKPPDDAGILQGVRQFRSGLPHVRVVLSPSPKNGSHFIPCEGRLEAAFAQALEIDPDVVAFRTQPFFFLGPKGRRLVCDFAVKWCNHTYTIVDIKPEGQLNRPSVRDRTAFVRTTMTEAEIPYRLVTDAHLEREPARSIRHQLRKGSGTSLPPGRREILLETLGQRRIALGAFRKAATQAGCPALTPEALALAGDITFPISAPLRESTLIGATHGTDISPADGWGTVRDVRLPL